MSASTINGTIKSVSETQSAFAVVVTNANPPPPEETIPNPPDWSRPLFRAGIGKTVEVTLDSGNVIAVKVSG